MVKDELIAAIQGIYDETNQRKNDKQRWVVEHLIPEGHWDVMPDFSLQVTDLQLRCELLGNCLEYLETKSPDDVYDMLTRDVLSHTSLLYVFKPIDRIIDDQLADTKRWMASTFSELMDKFCS